MTSESKTLVLLEPEETAKEVLEGIILDHDLSMQSAYDWEDALRLLAQNRPLAFVFTMRSLSPGTSEHVRQLKMRFPDIPLLGIRSGDTREDVVDLLKAGLYACLDPVQLAEEFAYNLIKLVASHTGTYNPLSLHYEEKLLILPNDFSLVLQVAKTLVENALPAGEKGRYHAILGLSEIITNAIEHGNLGISFEEKANALKGSRFYTLALERSHREPYKNRMVTVRSRVLSHRRRIEFFVADQGQGFDWKALPDPRDKGNMFRRHGRGILMARHAFDELHFSAAGNEVTLVLNLDAPARRRA